MPAPPQITREDAPLLGPAGRAYSVEWSLRPRARANAPAPMSSSPARARTATLLPVNGSPLPDVGLVGREPPPEPGPAFSLVPVTTRDTELLTPPPVATTVWTPGDVPAGIWNVNEADPEASATAVPTVMGVEKNWNVTCVPGANPETFTVTIPVWVTVLFETLTVGPLGAYGCAAAAGPASDKRAINPTNSDTDLLTTPP